MCGALVCSSSATVVAGAWCTTMVNTPPGVATPVKVRASKLLVALLAACCVCSGGSTWLMRWLRASAADPCLCVRASQHSTRRGV